MAEETVPKTDDEVPKHRQCARCWGEYRGVGNKVSATSGSRHLEKSAAIMPLPVTGHSRSFDRFVLGGPGADREVKRRYKCSRCGWTWFVDSAGIAAHEWETGTKKQLEKTDEHSETEMSDV